MTARYLIWSWEHRAWWRQAGKGYTPHIIMAGDFDAQFTADLVLNNVPPGRNVAVRLYDGLRDEDGWIPATYGAAK